MIISVEKGHVIGDKNSLSFKGVETILLLKLGDEFYISYLEILNTTYENLNLRASYSLTSHAIKLSTLLLVTILYTYILTLYSLIFIMPHFLSWSVSLVYSTLLCSFFRLLGIEFFNE